MDRDTFLELLEDVSNELSDAVSQRGVFGSSSDLERAVRHRLQERSAPFGIYVDPEPHPQAFPDIVVGNFGVEVKFTKSDSWRSVANSIFEGHRADDVKETFVLYGKMGGVPEVRWDRYADCVIHVRTSHVPRFELEIGAQQSLFQQFGVEYDSFRGLSEDQKMEYVRSYARGRLGEGEHLWWLEPFSDPQHALPINVRLYMNLAPYEKRRLRAEAAILCPEIVSSSRSRTKYVHPVMYILTYHGVLCPQARDLFSAGSVAGPARGGRYVIRALQDIEAEMRVAATELETGLFEEYWGIAVPPGERIEKWLERADYWNPEVQPSQYLFQG